MSSWGDLNEIASQWEKEGGLLRADRLMSDFREALFTCGLLDLKFLGPVFTWRGNRHGMEIKRSDRFVANKNWLNAFPASKVLHLKPSTSDHLPILVEVKKKTEEEKKKEVSH